MWFQNNYVKTLAGICLAVGFLIMLTADRTNADGNGSALQATDSDASRTVDQNRPSRPANTNHKPSSNRNHQGYQSGSTGAIPPHPYARTAPPPSFENRFLPPANYSPPPSPGYVSPASATRPPVTLPPHFSPSNPSGKGLPDGEWTNDSPLGKVTMTISGNKIAIDVACTGELAGLNPSMRGEFSVASDGTVYGLIHSVDAGIAGSAAEDMDEEWIIVGGLSDIPFSMRAYSEPDVLAIKQVSIGMPMQVVMATDGECGQFGLYAQAMMAGLYSREP